MSERDVDAEIAWAMIYSGYDRLAATPEQLERLLEPARIEYARAGRIPAWCGVDLLRGWAFLLQRADYFQGGGSLDVEWDAVLDGVRHHPAALPSDMPPQQSSRSD